MYQIYAMYDFKQHSRYTMWHSSSDGVSPCVRHLDVPSHLPIANVYRERLSLMLGVSSRSDDREQAQLMRGSEEEGVVVLRGEMVALMMMGSSVVFRLVSCYHDRYHHNTIEIGTHIT